MNRIISFINKIEVQGHRGNRKYYPENTINSFLSVIDYNIDTIEFDLLLTKDLKCIIHHNYRLNPLLCVDQNNNEIINNNLLNNIINKSIDSELCNEIPLISNLTLNEIKLYKLGNKKDINFPQQQIINNLHIPTLEELFINMNKYYSNNDNNKTNKNLLRFNLEIKREYLRPNEVPPVNIICTEIINIVKKYNLENRVSYSSFDIYILKELINNRNNKENLILSFLYSEEDNNEIFLNEVDDEFKKVIINNKEYYPSIHLQYILKTAILLNLDIVSPHYKLINTMEDILFLQHNNKFRVVLWTVNEPNDWIKFINFNVDGIITDDPQQLSEVLNNINQK